MFYSHESEYALLEPKILAKMSQFSPANDMALPPCGKNRCDISV